MNFKKLSYAFLGSCILLFSTIENVLAQQLRGNTPSLGGLSENATGPIAVVGSIAESACFVAGGAFILGTLVRYKEHRDNPTQVTWGQIITLFLLGVFFILLPFITGLSLSSEPIKNV